MLLILFAIDFKDFIRDNQQNPWHPWQIFTFIITHKKLDIYYFAILKKNAIDFNELMDYQW